MQSFCVWFVDCDHVALFHIVLQRPLCSINTICLSTAVSCLVPSWYFCHLLQPKASGPFYKTGRPDGLLYFITKFEKKKNTL